MSWVFLGMMNFNEILVVTEKAADNGIYRAKIMDVPTAEGGNLPEAKLKLAKRLEQLAAELRR